MVENETFFSVLGMNEGIKNLEKMIVKAKGYRMVIDWKMAYDEIKQITDRIKNTIDKKRTTIAKKGKKDALTQTQFVLCCYICFIT